MHNDAEASVIVARTLAAIDRAYPSGVTRSCSVAELAGHIDRIAGAWPLRVDYRSGPADRRGDLLSGPLYTSERHPWPHDGERWCEPIVQLDLTRWGAVGGRDVGQGLLQLWDPHDCGLVRVIPPGDLTDSPTPPPSEIAEDYAYALGDVGSETGRPAWLDRPGRIIGFGTPRLDWQPWHLLRCMEAITDADFDDSPDEAPAFRAELRAIADDFGNPEIDDRHRAFGMCAGNVFLTSAQQFLPPVLMTIEHDDRIFTILGSTLCLCCTSTAQGFTYSAHLFWE
jgi:hypothetical protein